MRVSESGSVTIVNRATAKGSHLQPIVLGGKTMSIDDFEGMRSDNAPYDGLSVAGGEGGLTPIARLKRAAIDAYVWQVLKDHVDSSSYTKGDNGYYFITVHTPQFAVNPPVPVPATPSRQSYSLTPPLSRGTR